MEPEPTDLGQQEHRSGFTRRDLLRGGVAAGVVGGVGLGALYFGYGSSVRIFMKCLRMCAWIFHAHVGCNCPWA